MQRRVAASANSDAMLPVNPVHLPPSPLSAHLRSGSTPESRNRAPIDDGNPAADDDNAAVVNNFDGVAEVPLWPNLTLGVIYDHLVENNGPRCWRKRLLNGTPKSLIKRFGDVINAMLNMLMGKNFLPSLSEKATYSLGKTKAQQKVQRELFVAMEEMPPYSSSSSTSVRLPDTTALSLVVAYLHEHLKAAVDRDGNEIDPSLYELDFMCRIIMLADDPESLAILNDIADPGAGRQVVDDPTQSTEAKWGRLTTEYVNNHSWRPENRWWDKDQRIQDISPENSPVIAVPTASVRAVWRLLRNKYSQCEISFKESGRLESSDDISAGDRFYDRHVMRWCRGDNEALQLALMFMYWVHDGAPPKLCTRSQVPATSSERGLVPAGDQGPSSALTGTTGKGKRTSDGLTKEDLIEVMGAAVADGPAKIALMKAKQASLQMDSWERSLAACQRIIDDADGDNDFDTIENAKKRKKQLDGMMAMAGSE